jgi:hypothetical protein
MGPEVVKFKNNEKNGHMFPISASTVKEAKQMQIHCQQKLIK